MARTFEILEGSSSAAANGDTRSSAGGWTSTSNGKNRSASYSSSAAASKDTGGTSPALLTATQRHYLLKLLVCAEMQDEWTLLDEQGGLRQYGAPFLVSSSGEPYGLPEQAGRNSALYPEHAESPMILLHCFHTHLRRFPGLDKAQAEYWQKQITPFFERLADAHLSNSAERSELTNRKVLNITATRYFSTFFARGIGLRGPGEQRGPGKATHGGAWGESKNWGRGTVKRGLDVPLRPSDADEAQIDGLFTAADDGKEARNLWKAGAINVQRVKRDWSAWKESIIESETGLDETLEQLHLKYMKNLPDHYRNAAEWVRRHVAFVIWTVLVKYPGGDEIFAIIKTIHFLFPYWGAKTLLKIANAQKMIKAIIDMVLARPLGAIDSLGQRIFFTIMRGEIDKINKRLLSPLSKLLDDADACRALEEYVTNRTSSQRAALLVRAKEEHCDVLIVILREYKYNRISEAQRWQEEYVNSVLFSNLDWAYPEECRRAKYIHDSPANVKNAIGQVSGAARKFALMKLYLRELLRKRDRQQVLAIGSGALVPTVIRQSLEIVFYKLLYQIALASDLSARLQDWQNFVDDLIRVKTAKQDSLEDYIALAARHEDKLYMFVHEIRDAVKPVFDWCQAALDFMALSTTNPYRPDDAKAKRVEVNLDAMVRKAATKDEEGKISVEAVQAELAQVERYVKWEKIKQEVAMRKEYALIHDDAITNVTQCQWQRRGLQTGVQADDQRVRPTETQRTRLEDLNGLMTELLDEAGLAIDDGVLLDGNARGTESGKIPWAYYLPDDILLERYAKDLKRDGHDASLRTYYVQETAGVQIQAPSISTIRLLLPAFRRELQRCLPDWQRAAKATPPR